MLLVSLNSLKVSIMFGRSSSVFLAAIALLETYYIFCVFYFIHLVRMVHVHLHRTLLALYVYLLVDSHHEIVAVDALQYAFYFLSVLISTSTSFPMKF